MTQQPPPRLTPATPLLRRLPPNATPDQVARAYADALLFILQTQPAQEEERRRQIDEMKAIVAVADATSQRASNAAAQLEGLQLELRNGIDVVKRIAEGLEFKFAEVLGHARHASALAEEVRGRAASIPDVAGAVATAAEAVRKLAEEVDEITDHGQERPPATTATLSVRVKEEVRRSREDEELEAWRARQKWIADVAKAVAAAVVGAGLLELGHLLFAHHP